jgi:hypothetical protein
MSTAARTVRAMSGVKTMPMTMMSVVFDWPRAVTPRIPVTTRGRARKASTKRPMTSSTRPRK